MRRAQMELLGLVFIVFLLALGMFFMLSITKEENIKSAQVSAQNIKIGQNTIDALKSVKVECIPIKRKIGLDELIQDLASSRRIRCSGMPSELYAKRIINNTLQMTLVNWTQAFYFRVTKEDHNYIEIQNLNCTEDMPGEAGYQPFPLRHGAGTVAMVLYVCT